MRKEYVQSNKRSKAIKLCPWAAYIYKADDGYWCFESYADYKVHKEAK